MIDEILARKIVRERAEKIRTEHFCHYVCAWRPRGTGDDQLGLGSFFCLA